MTREKPPTVFAVHLHRKPAAASLPDEIRGAENHSHAVFIMLEIAEDHGVLPEEHQISYTADDFATASRIDLGSSEVLLLRSDEFYVSETESTDDEDEDGKLEFWLLDYESPDVKIRRPVLVELQYTAD